MSNILRLRIVDKNCLDDETKVVMTQDNPEKQKPKRGRPRKNPLPPADPETIVVAKRRGRKRKIDKLGEGIDPQRKINDSIVPTMIARNFIVQLKIKASDLEKIQTQFINKSKKIGYDHQSNLQIAGKDEVTNSSEIGRIADEKYDFNEYYNLLNKLEMPLIPVSQQISEKMLPQIPNLYQNIVIPILPENVPLQLFDHHNSDPIETFRNTDTLLLPLLDNNHKWPEKSPYACWNCDTYFSGTPIGAPDKEVGGNFHCYGNFCWFSCAARYLSDHENTVDFWEKYSLLCTIYQMAYNLPPETKVPIAPPKETLLKYGGKLTYEQYHNESKLDQTVMIYKLPLIPVLLHISELSRSANINNIIQTNQQKHSKVSAKQPKTKKVIPIDPMRVSQAEANIKQKTQTLLQSKYTLDKCLRND